MLVAAPAFVLLGALSLSSIMELYAADLRCGDDDDGTAAGGGGGGGRAARTSDLSSNPGAGGGALVPARPKSTKASK
jgi:hypothetical protein